MYERAFRELCWSCTFHWDMVGCWNAKGCLLSTQFVLSLWREAVAKSTFFLSCCPAGYSGQDFDWADYQKQCGAEAAPHQCFRNVSSLFASVLLLPNHIKHDCFHGRTATRLWEVPQESVIGRKPEKCFRSVSNREKNDFTLVLTWFSDIPCSSSLSQKQSGGGPTSHHPCYCMAHGGCEVAFLIHSGPSLAWSKPLMENWWLENFLQRNSEDLCHQQSLSWE